MNLIKHLDIFQSIYSMILNGKNIVDYDSISFAQNLSIVLTEKLPPSNLTVFEIIALGRQPYTNWIGKLTEADLEKINQYRLLWFKMVYIFIN